MKHPSEAVRDGIIARLALSRAEIYQVLEPPPEAAGDAGAASHRGFPRSRTMQALLSGRGLGAVGAMAGGLLMARPGLAWRLIRLLPASAVARMLVGRMMSTLRARRAPKP